METICRENGLTMEMHACFMDELRIKNK